MRSRLHILSYFSLLLVMALVVVGCKAKSTSQASTVTLQATEAAPISKEAATATHTPRPTPTSRPTMRPTSTPTATPPTTSTPTPAPPTETPSPAPTATPSPTATAGPELSLMSSVPKPPAVLASGVLKVLDDPTVGPPISVHVSANHALEGYRFRLSGTLRNDTAENYAALGVVATFYTSDGKRYGPIKAQSPCLLLTPGAECPFILEATAKDLVAVALHPEGAPTTRSSATLTLNGLGRYLDNVGYVHLTGRVTNPHPFAVKNVTISGVLLNGAGEIVNVGMSILVDAVAAKSSAPFDVTIKYVPYVGYRLYVQGEPQ